MILNQGYATKNFFKDSKFEADQNPRPIYYIYT